jgi:6-phosphogluconolactonase/glucosamine-6-phosphate isomerase/deaminase
LLIDLRRRDGNTDVGEEEGTVAIALRCAGAGPRLTHQKRGSKKAGGRVHCDTVKVFMYDERIKNEMDPPLSGLSMIV